MKPMSKREYRILEFDKIRNLLGDEAASDLARAEIAELTPVTSPHIIRQRLAETSEAAAVLMRKGGIPLRNIHDVKGSVIYAEKGGALTMRQLLDVCGQLVSARRVAQFLGSDLPDLPIISSLAGVIEPHREIEIRIETCILSESDMADSASLELRRLRRAIGIQNELIRTRLNNIITSSSNKGLLQDSIVTMRQGRYVIPVKQEHKAKFPGMIHDQSSTGATFFIEPQAIVDLNNELRELELAEAREVERILAELSAEVAEAGHDIINNQDMLVKLDVIFAKGRLSAKQKASEAHINADGYLRVKNGRHPLIPAREVVPISLELGKNYKTLIITGPNTGGKTVTLKTVGLFVLMTEAGLHIPADDGAEIPLMENVFADIGDEQSIEQSLSTFSSHMKNIVDITSRSNARTLALLDELGAGTDPTEGAALGIAIIERLKSLGAMTIATTHYTELKKFAIATDGVENASMEFDVDTLSPTFKLRIGTPGRSNAFEISGKLGLDEGIIRRAAGLLGTTDMQFESVIRSIESDRKAAEAELDEAAMLKLLMKKQKDEFEREKAKFEEKRDKLISAAREEARAMVRETKEISDEIQRELRELTLITDSAEKSRRLDAGRKKLRALDEKYHEKSRVQVNKNPVDPTKLKVGDKVNVLSLGQNGEVISPPDYKGDVQVQIGRLRISVAAVNLSRIDGGKQAGRPHQSGHSTLFRQKVESVTPSISVRGENLEGALAAVDKYLDDAFIAGLGAVTIIHGRGEGILRDGIQRMLKSHRHVKSFRRGEYNEGGDGVTVCELREK
ncbi:MAG: endonuclease MutS2 [Clostridiales Family XIII bacterium]|jgi:DNA mismatch repair protein MutS2|nr:endonuclease MutS2 [Clostridiales Family XIII bacterium]